MFDLRRLPELPVEQWKENIKNDFEDPVFMQHPELLNIKKQLYTQGAVYASMTGSGSALYGIFKKGEKALIHTTLNISSHYMD